MGSCSSCCTKDQTPFIVSVLTDANISNQTSQVESLNMKQVESKTPKLLNISQAYILKLSKENQENNDDLVDTFQQANDNLNNQNLVIVINKNQPQIQLNQQNQGDQLLSTDGEAALKKGPVQLANGGIYEGEWLNNLRHGYGQLTMPDGSKYMGQWQKDKQHGIGKLIHPDGGYYEGEWANDQTNGQGIYTHQNGAIFAGQWKNDKQDGFGKEHWPDGAQYEGTYENGLKHGKGRLHFSDGSIYEGQFNMNLFDGYGEYLWNDGRKYKGQWKNNKMDGYGEIFWPDPISNIEKIKQSNLGNENMPGKKFIGQWQDGKQQGIGIYYNSSKEKKIGLWKNGKRLKWLEKDEYKQEQLPIEE